MGYKLTPRFYYNLSTWFYLSKLLGIDMYASKHKTYLFSTNSNIYHTINARTGLQVLLSSISKISLNIGVQAFTCNTVFQAIKNAGHKIIFLDIDNDFKLDLADLRIHAKNIDVLIITHTFGFPEYMDEIKSIIGNKILIEDCAHSFFSQFNGKQTGLLGDAAIFSTGTGKFPPIGTGGFCLINNHERFPYFNNKYNVIKRPSLIMIIKTYIKLIILSILMKPPLYGLITFPVGKKIDKKLDFIDKLSFLELKGFDWIRKTIKENEKLFNLLRLRQTHNARLLSSLLNIKTPIISNIKNCSPNYYAFPLLIKDRDTLLKKLLENNIESGKHFNNCIKWAVEFGYKEGKCPNTEKIIKKILTVPIHYGVSEKTIIKTAKIINDHIT